MIGAIDADRIAEVYDFSSSTNQIEVQRVFEVADAASASDGPESGRIVRSRTRQLGAQIGSLTIIEDSDEAELLRARRPRAIVGLRTPQGTRTRTRARLHPGRKLSPPCRQSRIHAVPPSAPRAPHKYLSVELTHMRTGTTQSTL